MIGNIPGGFAVTSNLQRVGYPLRERLVPILILPIPALLGGLLGYQLLSDSHALMQASALAFVAGLLLLATVEDTVPEADAPGAPRSRSGPAVAGGFSLILFISIYFG